MLTDQQIEMIVRYGTQALVAMLTLIGGWLLARWLGRFVTARVEKLGHGDVTLARVVGKTVRVVLVVLTAVAVLGQFGVQTASLVALIGAAGLAIGLALQGTLSNVAAGVMLLVFRPFRIGDFIDADGVTGVVEDIDLFLTRLTTPDNVAVLAPNSRIWGSQIRNFTGKEHRRIDLVVSISYSDDIDRAMAVVQQVLASEQRVLAEPAPAIVVGALGESSVDLFVRPWVATAAYWDVRFALTRAVKLAFDQNGITIPFPQRELHLAGGAAAAALTGKAG